MTDTADAVVIGAGILGASTARFLCKRGYGQVVLLEKDELASGATGYSAANVRQHYSNEVGIRLAVRGLQMFTEAEEQLGGPVGFRRCGYLVIAPPTQAQAVRDVVPLQQRFGVKTEIISADAIKSAYPALNIEGIELGCLEPDSGYADPKATVRTLVHAAQHNGLDLRDHTAVTGIELDGSKVCAVMTTAGKIETDLVVNAAGPWADRVGAMVGVSYGLSLSREHEAILEAPSVAPGIPVVSDPENRIFFRPHGDRHILVGQGYPKEQEPCDPDTYDDSAGEHALERMTDGLARRVPELDSSLRSGGYRNLMTRGYSGVYSITADWYPIVGVEPGLTGYVSAVGGSGHAFKIGPPIGESLAAVICGDPPLVELTALRSGRFDEGETFGSVWGPGNRA